jgi:predicted transcriptional regulator
MPASAPMERPDLYVIARLLERLWRENRAMLRTHLQVATNLNFDVMTKYLGWMGERGWVEFQENDSHQQVIIATKGREVYAKLVQVMNEVLRQER